VINLSSVAGIVGQANTLAYNASKGAVRLMTKSSAIECARGGVKVRVNSVHPGIIKTPMVDRMISDIVSRTGIGSNSVEERFAENHPVGRFGRPTDIANAIKFLASDAAAFMTGSELVVDGGWTAT
jgi:NAD(P)-dependent dehydrogenase (short-subunit alcohol dehydrogenase family)